MVSKGFRRKNMKRKGLRRKTLRRKTLRRKTLRRKTLRRKTLRRKTLRRKTLRRKTGGGNKPFVKPVSFLTRATQCIFGDNCQSRGKLVTNYEGKVFLQVNNYQPPTWPRRSFQ